METDAAGTYSHVWLYPDQMAAWKPVGLGKLGAWFLSQIASYSLVALVCKPRPPDDAPLEQSRARHEDRLTSRSRQSAEGGARGLNARPFVVVFFLEGVLRLLFRWGPGVNPAPLR